MTDRTIPIGARVRVVKGDHFVDAGTEGRVVNTAKEVIRRESQGVKWCYVCRKRVEFWFTLTRDAEPSYYDPNPSIDCINGHANGDLFPGYEREWE